ncbi:peptidoglycan recognition family protein [Streptomyces xiamenensis]|uniref:N-acetylmuramoyl-L-alanine amidase n=1 Tax=Streptomyces xiamenensis TaxID=408015 RepID=UPI003438A9CD
MRRRPPGISRLSTACTAVALALPLLLAGPVSPGAVAADDDRALQAAFGAAARESGVPEPVLLAVSYLSSRWEGHGGAPSVTGGYGPMHLTDAATALAGEPDRRGDDARTPQTLVRAAALTGLDPDELRARDAANVAGGAALLAEHQRALGLPPSPDPADWYGAVAAWSGADTREAAEVFADEVYTVLREGAARTTPEGQRVVLPATPVAPDRAQTAALGLPEPPRDPRVECPRTVSCAWLPAPYEELDEEGGYGNHDKADRPRSQSIDYIVIHDTEATWERTLSLVADPAYVSWHYSLRSADGHIAQHVPTKDVGWHAGNWYVNAKSIGLEHEGFLTDPDAWYTEAMYRTSARLVRHLARAYDIPLDRQHILGHDNLQGTVTANVPGMHTDPGPYWDWSHYFELLGAPLHPTAGPRGGLVTIAPDYDRHSPVYTDCDGTTCAPHGSSAVRLHTEPDAGAPLVRDIGTHPGGDGTSSTGVNDVGARATTGQRFAVAERRGEWTAIWYLGQKAWFHNPPGAPTAFDAQGWVVTGKRGAQTIPVYGRAYPQESAYPPDVPYQPVTPLSYEVPADQVYAMGLRTSSEYYRAVTFDPAGHQVVRGETYYQIQVGHRIGFVKASDVTVRWSAR